MTCGYNSLILAGVHVGLVINAATIRVDFASWIPPQGFCLETIGAESVQHVYP